MSEAERTVELARRLGQAVRPAGQEAESYIFPRAVQVTRGGTEWWATPGSPCAMELLWPAGSAITGTLGRSRQ